MTLPGCTVVASDTATHPDPLPFWGSIDCQDPTRQAQYASGGDTQLTASGAPQPAGAFRRMTVYNGDNFYGSRCELGHNDVTGPTVFYREGQRRVTFASIRLPGGTDPNATMWRTVLQMRETQPYYNPGHGPALELEVREGHWILSNSWSELWRTPAQQNTWTRFAFDVTYSSNPSVGSIKAYVDLNGDGNFTDPGEQSPTFHVATLRPEIAGGPSPYAPGESIPSHLRAGIYQNPAYDCPSGCSVDLNNVQVIAP